MGLLDKVKGILFDETEEDEIEELPKREPKKNKKNNFIDYKEEEDTIKEVKVDYSKEEKSNTFDDFEPVTRTRSNISYEEFERPKVSVEALQEPVREPVRKEVVPERKVEVQKNRYELPPKKETTHEQRDYKKLLNDAKKSEKKPFEVTPIISPVYGIIDKNYKPEEIVEKNKPKIDDVRERMFGPVSYNDEAIPEPVKYEESNETLTEKLISENKKQIEKEVVETSEFDEIVEDTVEVENTNEVVEESTSPSIDISDLINEVDSNEYDTSDYSEDFPYKSVSEEPTEEINLNVEPREEEVSEHLDDTIETDLFNLIDSMYKTDERE